MELVIPYQWTAIDITTYTNGDLRFIFPNDTNLQKFLITQLFNHMSHQEFIEAIGSQEFEVIVDYYHTEFDKE